MPREGIGGGKNRFYLLPAALDGGKHTQLFLQLLPICRQNRELALCMLDVEGKTQRIVFKYMD